MSSFGFETTSEQVVDAFADQVKGRTFLITGTSANGLGAKMATALASKSPAQLILVSRNKAKVEPVIDQIASIDSSIQIIFVSCELADLDSVRQAAKSIQANDSIAHIDVLINNAGVMHVKEFTKSPQGIELSLASNHLGHFLLTNLLAPKLTPTSRVINVASSGHRISPFRFTDYNFADGAAYDGWSAYGQSKTANMLFTVALAGRGRRSLAVNPGAVYDTGLATHLDTSDLGTIGAISLRNTGVEFVIDSPKSQSQGAAAPLVAALDPALDGRSGRFLEDCQVTTPFEYAADEGNAEKLWKLSEELVGEKFVF